VVWRVCPPEHFPSGGFCPDIGRRHPRTSMLFESGGQAIEGGLQFRLKVTVCTCHQDRTEGIQGRYSLECSASAIAGDRNSRGRDLRTSLMEPFRRLTLARNSLVAGGASVYGVVWYLYTFTEDYGGRPNNPASFVRWFELGLALLGLSAAISVVLWIAARSERYSPPPAKPRSPILLS